MAFTGHEDHSISLQEASDLARNYRSANPSRIKGEFFGRDDIESILAQEDCVGIRIYYGLDTQGTQKLVLVGVDGSENDLYNGVLMQQGQPCPPICGQSSPLNS